MHSQCMEHICVDYLFIAQVNCKTSLKSAGLHEIVLLGVGWLCVVRRQATIGKVPKF